MLRPAACAAMQKASMSRSPIAWTLLLAAVASGTACVVVPVDPRTGQPYPAHPGSTSVTVVNPAPAAPPAAAVLSARLYPLNAAAGKAGMLTALVVDQQGGRGSFNVGYLGDMLQGEATRVDGGYASFGRVHNDVLGPMPTQRSFSGQRGIANGYGARGTSVQCEYLISGPGRGTGVCQFSDGAHYQMHFRS
jgi:hypothetical protein